MVGVSRKCLYIAGLASLGCFARIFTDELFNSIVKLEVYGPPFVKSFVSNAMGSFILGALTTSGLDEDTLPGIYTGLTTGFCGSYTTYSGWNLEMSHVAVEEVPFTGMSNVAVAIGSILVSVVFFTSSYIAGGDTMLAADRKVGETQVIRVRYPKLEVTTGATILLFAILTLLVILDGPQSEQRRVYWLSGLMAPFGALTRFFLGRWLNSRWMGGKFPWGTFAANVSGSVVLGLIHYMGPDRWQNGDWESSAVSSFRTGFVSSLTTMSTFVGEVVGHRTKHGKGSSYVYLTATVLTTQGILAILHAAWDG